jgi:hypothetical protein
VKRFPPAAASSLIAFVVPFLIFQCTNKGAVKRPYHNWDIKGVLHLHKTTYGFCAFETEGGKVDIFFVYSWNNDGQVTLYRSECPAFYVCPEKKYMWAFCGTQESAKVATCIRYDLLDCKYDPDLCKPHDTFKSLPAPSKAHSMALVEFNAFSKVCKDATAYLTADTNEFISDGFHVNPDTGEGKSETNFYRVF